MKKTIPRPKVDLLKKITLNIAAGTTPLATDAISQPLAYTFIFGLGTTGLTPFEYTLADKSLDDEVLVQVAAGDRQRMFQHLRPPGFEVPAEADPIYLKIRIVDIQPTSSREIIGAMAQMAECGGDCDCGCSCGGADPH